MMTDTNNAVRINIDGQPYEVRREAPATARLIGALRVLHCQKPRGRRWYMVKEVLSNTGNPMLVVCN